MVRLMVEEFVCDVCNKKSKFEGLVWYYEFESFLCRNHYRLWGKVDKSFEEINGDVGGKVKLCKEIEKVYVAWVKDQKKVLK